MATKYLLNNEIDIEEIDELEDPEVPEMGMGEEEEDGIELPKNSDETDLDDLGLKDDNDGEVLEN